MAKTSFTERELRGALGRFATGITVITVRGEGDEPEGLTANSFTSLSLDPPLVLWCLAKRSASLAAFSECEYFTINVLAAHQKYLSQRFATSEKNKFDGIEWSEGLGGAPVLAECLVNFECRRHARHDGGDHMIFVGEVARLRSAEGDPLLFNAGHYGVAAGLPEEKDELISADEFSDLLL